MTLPEQAILDELPSTAASAAMEVEAAVRQNARLVFRIAYSVLRNHHDAEDVAQEAFMRLLRVRKGIHNVRDVRSYLARTAWRVALGRKKTRTEVALEEATEAVLRMQSAGASADQILADRQAAALVGSLIEALPANLRRVLLLSAVEELSSPEIGGILGIPEGSVRTRLRRARQLLHEKLSALLAKKR